MDTLRGNLDALAGSSHEDATEEDVGHDFPPPGIANDERRMQVRAYNFWAGLLDDRNYPNVADLDPDKLPDFGPHGVLLDFSQGLEDPAIAFLGEKLSEECGASGMQIARLSDVPARSLLSRITDHYMQILANQAPIGFEAEFVNQRCHTVLYRGILLPFSSDDVTIDFIFGAINWKELADQQSSDELLLEIDQALEEPAAPSRKPLRDLPLADWADGPASLDPNDRDDMAESMPFPTFGLGERGADAALPDPEQMGLADWLASAREMAETARSSEDRTRKALYDAISRAYDFALAAAQAPGEFAEMIEDAGLTAQERAPMTPLVKLVFGAEYDKTRLTEYAAALTHAQRKGLGFGELGDFLRDAEGGLKGVVNAERQLRKQDAGDAAQTAPADLRKTLAKKLRAIEPREFSSISTGDGREFSLVMIRRTEAGEIVMLGEVPGDLSLVEKAARQLLR